MGINANQFHYLIVRPVLRGLQLQSDEAEALLMGTCAQETQLGQFLKQADGKALGVYQMEPRIHDDIWAKYLPNQPILTNALMQTCKFSTKPGSDMMLYNLYYATAMARIFYLRIPESIPKTLEGQAQFYKKWYNTPLGSATSEHYLANYKCFVMGEKNVKK